MYTSNQRHNCPENGEGGRLFDDYKDLTNRADAILGFSVKELCLDDPNALLKQTQYAQPALFIVNSLTYLKKIEQMKVKPDFVAGHSLGEYNALHASGAFDFESGVKLVKKRGDLMSMASGGGMAAVIGLSETNIDNIIKENNFKIKIANYNTPSQLVISGSREDIEKAKLVFESSGARMYVPLNVSGAFHSPYMNSAKEEFAKFIHDFNFSELKIPVISNVYARAYEQEKIKETLTDQIDHPVKWTESIQYLMGKGDIEFEEIGSGTVLAGLIRTIKKEAKPLII